MIQNSKFNNNIITPTEDGDDTGWSWGWGFDVGNGDAVPFNTIVDGVSSSNNTRGATIFSNGDVTISNSHFDSNTDASPAGLTIWSGGIVTLNNVSASNNIGGDGADIYGPNHGGDPGDPLYGSPASIVIQNSVFSGNAAPLSYDFVDGLWINFGCAGATVSGSVFFGNGGYGLGGVGCGTLQDYGNYYGGNALGTVQLGAGGGTLVTTPVSADQLPGALPPGFIFAAGLNVNTMANGAQVSFDVPVGTIGPLTVLWWNGTLWVEVPSSVVGGKVVFTPTGTGTFVLVTR